MNLPESFHKNISQTYGDKGNRWLEKLPQIFQQCLSLWQLHSPAPLGDMSFSYVASVYDSANKPCVLKLAFPDEAEFHTEIAALEAYGGKHTVCLLNKDKKLGAILLERLSPGQSLKGMQNESRSLKIAGKLMGSLLQEVPQHHNFPHFTDWLVAIDKCKHLLDKKILKNVDTILTSLSHFVPEQKLIHGDLHHDNILYDEKRGWTVIDPKGIIGHPALQASRFLRNFWGVFPSEKVYLQRITILAKALDTSPIIVGGYAYLDFIIGNCWIIQEQNDHPIDDRQEAFMFNMVEKVKKKSAKF